MTRSIRCATPSSSEPMTAVRRPRSCSKSPTSCGAKNAMATASVWTDAEEAVRQWSDADSLYGTKHLAAKWQQDGTIKKIKAFLLADMIGDADLNIERETNSTPWL